MKKHYPIIFRNLGQFVELIRTRGSPFLFPESFMQFMMLWKQYLDYRSLEGMARSHVDLGIIPQYSDYTTIWNRIHDMKPDLDISGLEYAEIGTDGTGLKTNNAGSYRIQSMVIRIGRGESTLS